LNELQTEFFFFKEITKIVPSQIWKRKYELGILKTMVEVVFDAPKSNHFVADYSRPLNS